MFQSQEFYKKYNEPVMESYNKQQEIIGNIAAKAKEKADDPSKGNYYKYFALCANDILQVIELEKTSTKEYYLSKDFDELLKENQEYFNDVIGSAYDTSYANPKYSVSVFGDKIGQLMSVFYLKVRYLKAYAVAHKIFMMEESIGQFIKLFNYVNENTIDYDALKAIVIEKDVCDQTRKIVVEYSEQFKREASFLNDIIENYDLNDPRYLLAYKENITENEIKTFEFLKDYPQEKIEKMSQAIVKAYFEGFARDGKKVDEKSTVTLIYYLGQEKLVQQVIQDLKEKGFDTIIRGISSTRINRQYSYDHRFDLSLYLSQEYMDMYQKNYRDAMEQCKDFTKEVSGIIFIDRFGEPPFSPESKEECLKLAPEQQQLMQMFNMSIMKITDEYISRSQTSFTIVAFPSPEIKGNFEEIFESILEINMLDSSKYEEIQKKIIEALDKGEYVHVKGKAGNLTDIKVQLHKLNDPAKETNFLNCGANLNIPVGEVFTSPTLTGTNGTLHIKETFLRGLQFKDLKLDFKDGFVSEYTCKNFDNEEQNKKYIEENLLFPHKTLPIGEFAIGTNTLAYVAAQKFQIMDVLPILIIEKMGPHFAIGDTCFTMKEDIPVHNCLDNKEVIARDNEKTILRKEDPSKAYTSCHTDITLPYEGLEFISSITADGEKVDIIRDGKFVVPGTEELNKPFEDN